MPSQRGTQHRLQVQQQSAGGGIEFDFKTPQHLWAWYSQETTSGSYPPSTTAPTFVKASRHKPELLQNNCGQGDYADANTMLSRHVPT